MTSLKIWTMTGMGSKSSTVSCHGHQRSVVVERITTVRATPREAVSTCAVRRRPAALFPRRSAALERTGSSYAPRWSLRLLLCRISGAPLAVCTVARYAPSSRYSLLRRLPLAAGGATFWPPVGSATRSNGRCAMPHPSAPQGAQRCAASAATLCSRHGQSAQPAADRSAQRLIPRRRWAAPAAGWAARHHLESWGAPPPTPPPLRSAPLRCAYGGSPSSAPAGDGFRTLRAAPCCGL